MVEAARAEVTRVVAGAWGSRARIIDVRESDEVASGRIPGALHIPRGFLELRVEQAIRPDEPVVVYCASGTRSLLAARTLLGMGYADVVSLEGGFDAWKAAGRPVATPPQLSPAQRQRYARHLLLPEVGEAGQLSLQQARVLVIGAGGLGSPVALYLAAAGVGTLGMVDDDTIDVGNLQRQIMHRTSDAGELKVESARRAIEALNPEVKVETFPERFGPDNADSTLALGWDVVVDGTDVIRARYLIGDACARFGVPLVHGAIHRFEGQVSVFDPARGGPCYRCLFPVEPPPEAVPSCAEAGVLGSLPGVIGTLQAMEALKLILGLDGGLKGRLLRYDGLRAEFETLRFSRDPACSHHPEVA